MRVPEVVRQILDLTGMKQEEFAKEADVSQGTVSKWLSEQQSPNKRQWDTVLALIAADSRLVHLLSAAGGPTIARVPLLDFVSAGKLADAASQIPVEDVPLLAFADLGRGDFFALKVTGDSMDRLSPEGSIIVVNRADRDLIHDKAYVFSHRGEATYKLWQPDPPHLAPYSWNPANKPIFVKGNKDFGVVGRVKRSVLDLD